MGGGKGEVGESWDFGGGGGSSLRGAFKLGEERMRKIFQYRNFFSRNMDSGKEGEEGIG